MLDKTTLLETTAPVGFRLVSSEVIDLTPEVVREFRKIEATATERALKEGRVEHLNDKIERGLAVTFHWVTASLNGKTRRANGQHSSDMLEKRIINDKFPAGLKCHREHYEVDNGEALAVLFRQFDDRASGRSPLDISGVYQGLHPELENVDRKIAKLAVDGDAWYQRYVVKAPTARGDDVYGMFNDTGFWPLLQWLNTLLAGRCSEMKYPQVIAAVIGTYMTNESAARDFWQHVVNLPNGDDDDEPHNVLSNWLLAIQAKKIERPAPANVFQGSIYAWNAFRDGKSITAIRDDIKKNFYPIHE